MWTLIPNRFAYEATYYTLADLYDENANAWTALSDELTFGDIFSKHAAGVDFSALNNDVLNQFLREFIWPRFYDSSVGMITRQVCEPEPTPEELEEVYAGKAALIYSWLQGSRQKYETLIKIYNDSKDNLMSQLESTTISESTSTSNTNYQDDTTNTSKTTDEGTSTSSEMFSDTPQDGALFTDGRTTTARKTSNEANSTSDVNASANRTGNSENTGTGNSTTTTKVDAGTIMSRISEIQENIRNLFNDWSDEFKQFVIY